MFKHVFTYVTGGFFSSGSTCAAAGLVCVWSGIAWFVGPFLCSCTLGEVLSLNSVEQNVHEWEEIVKFQKLFVLTDNFWK